MEIDIKINGNPLTEITPIQRAKTAIIYYHGFSSSKERSLFRARILASLGYYVLIPDACGHGLRADEMDIDFDKPDEKFWDVLIKTITESPDLINYLCEKKGFSPKNIVFAGHSMGAMAAAGVFIKSPMGSLCAFNGCLDYEKLAEYFNKIFTHNEEELARIKEKIRYYSPSEHLSKLENRNILMIDGDKDILVPARFNTYVTTSLAPFFKDKSMCNHLVLPRTTHEMTIKSLEIMSEWLKKLEGEN